MNIVGKGFLLLLGCVTLASAGMTLWLWPRLAGRGPRPLAGRIGLLLGTQLSLAATFLFTINALGGFYTSWAQLFGDSSAQYNLNNAGAAGAAAHDTQQLTVASDGHGRLVGVRSGVAAQVAVFTPAGYASPTSPPPSASPPSSPSPPSSASPPSATRYFPVEIVDLTGHSAGLSTSGPLPNFQQIATGYHLIVAVVTAPAVIPGVNVPAGTQGELFWSQDLRAALIAHYRVDTSPADWGVAGVAQSGGAAINLAVQDSTSYGLAAAVGNWTSALPQDSWPGIDKYLAAVPTPAVRLLYDPTAPDIPSKLRLTEGTLQVATQSGLTLTSALDWLGASIRANAGVVA
ncbi:hypothetical protein [Actinospica sp.]|uniref:hypothetical protein n=1 Tax=Actinospica sp. TaxID=1872142 RepID=UPI002CABC883|nr:hypothetical protein [Actinospica sp.]HWG24890.1 hypothetical protein [Actinospica sp.]